MAYAYDKLSEKDKNEIIDAFNEKSKKGLALLDEKLKTFGITDPDKLAAERARFFIADRNDLNLVDIGDYLGAKENEKTLKAFFDQMEFKGLEFTDALRKFLTAFDLPGEAQKIDRIMEAFAKKYVEQNPGKFKHEDAAYVLAFSIIMLNTDLHNPAIAKKISLQQFIKNNRGINDGGDFSDVFLEEVYNKIKTNEIEKNTTPADELLGVLGRWKKANDEAIATTLKTVEKTVSDPANKTLPTLEKIVKKKKLSPEDAIMAKKLQNEMAFYQITLKGVKDSMQIEEAHNQKIYEDGRNNAKKIAKALQENPVPEKYKIYEEIILKDIHTHPNATKLLAAVLKKKLSSLPPTPASEPASKHQAANFGDLDMQDLRARLKKTGQTTPQTQGKQMILTQRNSQHQATDGATQKNTSAIVQKPEIAQKPPKGTY
jgi:hypothetical protein